MNKDFVILDECDVLWSGWESDDKMWLVMDCGSLKLMTTDHGSKYFEDKSFIEGKIREYEAVIEKSRYFLEVLNRGSLV